MLAPQEEEEETAEEDEIDQLPADELVEVLADYFCLISYIHSLPRELYRIERDIFYNIRKKRTFALELIRYRKSMRRRGNPW